MNNNNKDNNNEKKMNEMSFTQKKNCIQKQIQNLSSLSQQIIFQFVCDYYQTKEDKNYQDEEWILQPGESAGVHLFLNESNPQELIAWGSHCYFKINLFKFMESKAASKCMDFIAATYLDMAPGKWNANQFCIKNYYEEKKKNSRCVC